jgi:glycine/D-amino acid oxidase-like deaminating enzyme
VQRGANESISVWQENEKTEPSFSPLRENTNADICIVGAGIAGLTTGYMLAKAGKSVVILDAWGLAAGETSRTTAHLTAVLDDRFFELESLFGEDGARLAAESHMSAINHIEAIVKEEKIDCDFERVDGYLIALDDNQRKDFDKEQPAAKRAGFAVDVHSKVPVVGITITAPTMRFPQQGTFHIMNYIIGLAAAFQKLGGRIYTGSHVNEVKGGKEAYVKTDDGIRSARSIFWSPPIRRSTIG